MRLLFLSLLLVIQCEAIETNIEITGLENFRVGNVRNVTIYVPEVRASDAVVVSLECVDTSVCRVVRHSQLIENDSNRTDSQIDVVVEALFLGITKMQLKLDNEPAGTYTVRVMRAQFYVTMATVFAVFIAIFVLCVTFMMGTQLELERIKAVLKKPVGPCIGLFCQFILMPLVGFCIAEFLLPDDQMVLKLALFAASTCPGGGKSSFWTIIFNGNLDLSVAMTFTQTISALVMMPLWMSTLAKHFTDQRVQIPFMNIIEGLLVLMIPSSAGMYFIRKKPHLVKKINVWIKRVTWTATIFFTTFMIIANWYIFFLFTWRTVLCGCLLPWSGYLVAFTVATIFRQENRDKITICIETGVQNVGIALMLMLWCLPEPEVDISMTILFAVMLSTDKPLVIIWLVRKARQRWCTKSEKEPKTVKYHIGQESSSSEITQTSQIDDFLQKPAIFSIEEGDEQKNVVKT